MVLVSKRACGYKLVYVKMRAVKWPLHQGKDIENAGSTTLSMHKGNTS